MICGARELMMLHKILMTDIEKDDFSKLELVHHLSSGYKALFTTMAYESMEKLRQACGGSGFSAFSGLPEYILDYSPSTTFEGDNTIMLQ